ncbi:MAG: BatD family protein [Bacteroidota bacterium]
MQISFLPYRLLLILLLISSGWIPLAAQGKISFKASADAKQVVLGNYFELSFILENANAENFKAPKLEAFNILSGPNQATSVSAINGRWTRSQTFSYTLQPKKIGTFTIGAGSVVANGETLKSKPLRVEVVKGKNKGASTQEDLMSQIRDEVFIRAETNTIAAAIGEQIILDYKIYTTREIETYNLLSESEYPGFFAQDIRRYNAGVVREVVDGVQYSTKILKRIALFPQQAGILKVDPMTMQLAVVADNQPKRRRSFFYTPVVNRLQVKTEELNINVRPLPSPQPSSFSGAVGTYRIESTVNRSSLTTDDAITIRMTISGDGDIKRVQAPTLQFSDSLELYEPRVVEERSFEGKNGRITGQKLVEYVLLPKHPGRYQIEPEFTYFDPDSSNYISLSPNTYRFIVTKGTLDRTAKGLAAERAAAEDIRFIKTKTQLEQASSSFFGTPLFWALLSFPFLGLLGAVFYRQAKIKQAGIDPIFLKQQRARKIAQGHLSKADNFMKSGDSRSFYKEISQALFGYVGDKLSIPLSELSKDNIRQKLEALKVDEQHIKQFIHIIKTCEMALFAGKDQAAAMKEMYQGALDVVVNIEAAF